MDGEISSLLKKGCISQIQTKPHVVDPFAVAYSTSNKPRLVMDCRNFNSHFYQFKFKYEGGAVARNIFEKGDFLYSFDLKSAYHHISTASVV